MDNTVPIDTRPWTEDECKLCKLSEWCLVIGVLCPWTTCYTAPVHHILCCEGCCCWSPECIRGVCSPYGLCGWLRILEGFIWCIFCPIGVFVAIYYYIYVKYQIHTRIVKITGKRKKLTPYFIPVISRYVQDEGEEVEILVPVKNARNL